MKRILWVSTAVLLGLASAQAQAARPAFKPTFQIVDLDRTRISSDRHLISFRLLTKVNVPALLDVCISDSNTGVSSCSNTITARPEDSSQAVFVIAGLTDRTSLSIRWHNQRGDLAVQPVPKVSSWSWLSAIGWAVILSSFAGLAFWAYRIERKVLLLKKDIQASRVPDPALSLAASLHQELTPIQKTLEDLGVRDRTLMGDLGILEKRFDEAHQDLLGGQCPRQVLCEAGQC